MAAPSDIDGFIEEWLIGVNDAGLSTTEIGSRFARKLLTQWLGLSEDVDDLFYCDGSGDGGIDIAYLQRHDSGEGQDDPIASGDIWYLVQSKFGSAFKGTNTLLQECQQVIDTVDGGRAKLSSVSKDLVERLQNFRKTSSENDRLILVFATTTPLSALERRVLLDIKAIGKERLGPFFDVEDISIATIYERVRDLGTSKQRLKVPIRIQTSESSGRLLVGAVSIYNYYQFLRQYKNKTSDLDQIFERNVRQFLGNKAKVNKQMQATLKDTPHLFGLYNNGITIVASGYSYTKGKKEFELVL